MASCWEDWQSTKNTVLERSRHMFNNPFMSDVVLTCEGSDKKFFAHKYVLATSSAVFYAMFYGKLAEKNSVVHLSDTNKESLEEFLRFLYTDESELTTDNAMLVLYLANKYIVPSLAQKCIRLLEANITTANIFTILQQAIQICEEKLQNRCWDMIDLNTSEVVTSNAFIDIDHAILLQFLKRETLKIKETDLFLAVLRWSEAECLRKRIEGNAKNKRAVLGNVIYEIRFASMTAQEFAQNISGTGLLTTEEMVLFYETFSGKEKASEIWNMSERGASLKEGILLRCSRFVGHKCFEKNLGTYQTVGVSFSKPVRLHGVRLFGYLRCEYDVTLEVFTQQVQKKGYAEKDSRGVPGFDVLLPAPIKIQADVPVHLKATILGPKSTFGVEGRVTVNVNHMTVTFFEIIEHRRHYIPVKYGQFDQIIFSEC